MTRDVNGLKLPYNLRIKEPWRNHGSSWGLEYPIIFGEIGIGFATWDRHTGYVTRFAPNPVSLVDKRLLEKLSMPNSYYLNPADQDSVS